MKRRVAAHEQPLIKVQLKRARRRIPMGSGIRVRRIVRGVEDHVEYAGRFIRIIERKNSNASRRRAGRPANRTAIKIKLAPAPNANFAPRAADGTPDRMGLLRSPHHCSGYPCYADCVAKRNECQNVKVIENQDEQEKIEADRSGARSAEARPYCTPRPTVERVGSAEERRCGYKSGEKRRLLRRGGKIGSSSAKGESRPAQSELKSGARTQELDERALVLTVASSLPTFGASPHQN
ncbi:hypothetical protein DFH07DRAFT_1030236 [Mycena maculata]|uniref:Uncharacterized protein n=1 Tax=Mycena maculata TaxID=230809 RepID=A0AAD7K8S8_9AGAR|nr:hypothetical protein DFH07DRAFT_1030236 [Mycena maculata]